MSSELKTLLVQETIDHSLQQEGYEDGVTMEAGTQIISQELPRHVSQRQINENILVLPLQMQKRRQLQMNEQTQTSKKSLCLQETFPEGLITLNRELLEKRLLASGYQTGQFQSNSGSSSGLKSARESYKTILTTEQALKGDYGTTQQLLLSAANLKDGEN